MADVSTLMSCDESLTSSEFQNFIVVRFQPDVCQEWTMRSVCAFFVIPAAIFTWPPLPALAEHNHDEHIPFSIRSVTDGNWSDAATWKPARVPSRGDRVLISRGTHVRFDVNDKSIVRLVQVVGTLEFARDRDTELNVGLLTVQHTDMCSEHGFACEFEGADKGPGTPIDQWPSLIVGTQDSPIPAQHTAVIRLHYLAGMNPKDAPAIACCSGRMEFHGSPLSRTWVKLDADLAAGAAEVTLSEAVSGWRVGDEVIVTASNRAKRGSSFRPGSGSAKEPQTEQRTIKAINGTTVTLDAPLKFVHSGNGEFRSEIANLSRNVVIESANPQDVRGHTVYHRFSTGGISYTRFAHLGKEGVLGRYSIHFHLVGDTMRGSSVQGASIVDSHNRWVTIHGTQYLIVRDCVGYQSVGHGYFLEDGTEVYNLLDRNLAVQAYQGKKLPGQVLSFDPNDGAGFWWANGLNTITRNVTSENDEYGYRYDMQKRSNFDTNLPIRQPDGSEQVVDVRTLPIWRFEDNEAHAEGFYGMLVAANGSTQPDSPIHDERMLERIRNVDWTGPDTQHPHMIRNLSIWGSHYAFRPHSPAMRMENVRIHKAAYGIYRPAFENHEYTNLHISNVGAEPFNRGMDDASAQTGRISVDGLTFSTGYGNGTTPLVQISDVNINGDAETHIRNVKVNRPEQFQDRWPLFNRGVGTKVPPITRGVPIFIHDYFGPGRHAKVVSTAAKDLISDGNDYREEPTLTGSESRVAEVSHVKWPKLLDPIDDLPPVTVITSIRRDGGTLVIRGISHDNGEIVAIHVNSQQVQLKTSHAGVTDWSVEMTAPRDGKLTASAIDDAGNAEQTAHTVLLPENAIAAARKSTRSIAQTPQDRRTDSGGTVR